MNKYPFKETIYFGNKLSHDLIDPDTGEIIIPANRKLVSKLVQKARSRGISISKSMLRITRNL